MEVIKEYPIEFVCILGIAIVFIGLVCIVLLCKILGALCNLGTRNEVVEQTVSAPAVAPAPAAQNIPNRKKIVAAVSAAIAEELGTDVSAIRIVSFKKI